jgi:hypothetical protein
MIARLGYPAVLDDHDIIRMSDRVEPMRNHKQRLSLVTGLSACLFTTLFALTLRRRLFVTVG